MALEVLKIDLNHCDAAQKLVHHTVREEKVAVVFVSYQYRNLGERSWRTDATGSSVMWACSKQPFQEVTRAPESYFLRLESLRTSHQARYWGNYSGTSLCTMTYSRLSYHQEPR
uniref:Uncharacterized protein n=1 Tax=Bracon brevicornis TaxID=1563983 RepID=A0A6V7INB7_9HYME